MPTGFFLNSCNLMLNGDFVGYIHFDDQKVTFERNTSDSILVYNVKTDFITYDIMIYNILVNS